MRLLGDVQWLKAIALLNKLKAPYVSSRRSPGVLAPGDKLLIPAVRGSTKGNQVYLQDPQLAVNGVDPFIEVLGTDILLKEDMNTGLVDFSISTGGDTASISGTDNLMQAMTLRLKLGKGDLRAHPSYGLTRFVGQKATISNLFTFEQSLKSSLLVDDRIGKIDTISAQYVDANVAEISLRATVNGMTGKVLDITKRVGG